MSGQWHFNESTTVTLKIIGSSPLVIAVELRLRFEHKKKDAFAEPLSAVLDLRCPGVGLVWPPELRLLPPDPIKANSGAQLYDLARIGWDRQTLTHIDHERGLRRIGPLIFDLGLTLNWRVALPTPGSAAIPDEGCAFTRTFPKTCRLDTQLRLDRDQWAQILLEAQVGDFEIIELPVRRLDQVPGLKETLKCVRAAEDSFRHGDYQATVLEARKSVEAAAHLPADGSKGASKNPFENLANKAFPAKEDEPRRALLRHLGNGIAELRHAAGHAKDGLFDTTRLDAEVALRLAVEFLRYVEGGLATQNR